MAITYIQPAIVNASASYTFASVNATSSITVSGGTVVASVLITAIGYPGDDTAADTAGGQTITLTGSGFAAGASVIINGSAVAVVSVVSSTTITFTSPAQSTGSYPLYVVNTNGSTGIAVPGIQYSGTPTWTTAAGSLGSYTETVAIANTVTATGDAPITYSLYSGSLPTGATLNTSNGYISGTSPLEASPTTFTFTIRATDAQAQDTDRQFSLTINPDVVTWSSPANGTTYSSTANSAISNVTMSASAASGQSITYTANALPTGLSISGSNIYGTPTVVANSSSLLTATAATTNKTATRTINWVISVANDTYFPYVSLLLSANTPSSTFVTDASTNNFAITVNGDTRPNNLNPYTPGYYSNYFDGTGDYLSVADNAALQLGSSDFTIEFWAYSLNDNSYWIAGKGDAATVAGSEFSFYNGGSTWDFYYSGGSTLSITKPTLTVNQWIHVAVVRSSTTITIYRNGVVNSSGTIGANTLNTGGSSALQIGSYATTGFNGYISNFRIVKGTAVYTSAFTPSTSPLTAITNTSLLTCQSNRLIDNSTNNFTITKNGDTTVSGFIPFTPNSSYSTYGSGYFSGSGSLTAASNTAFSLTGDFTIECWVYLTSAAGTKTVYTNRTSYSNATGLAWVTQSGSQAMSIYTASAFSLTSSISITLNAWTHIALTRSGSTMTQWVNGASGGTATISNSFTDAQCFIGVNNSSGEYWPGYITDFRIVKGTAVYTTAFTPPSSPLTAIANTSLLTLQNNQPNTNNMFVDNSTNNLLITRTANSTQGSVTPYAGTWSNYFDGTGDYLSIAANAAFGFGTGDWTIECWIYMTSMSHYNTIFDTRVGSGTQSGSFSMGIFSGDGTGTLQLFSGGAFYNPSNTFSSNTWYHIAVVKNSGVTKLYVNGTGASTSYSDSRNYGSSQPVQIGNDDASNYFQGYISNMRVVKGTAVYTTNFTSPSAPLTQITNTSLLTCQSNRLIDNSIINSTIVKNGDTTVQKFSPFTVQTATVPTSYSGYFDGAGDYLTNTLGSGLQFSGDFTVECWVYPVTRAQSYPQIFGNYTNFDGGGGTFALWAGHASGTTTKYQLGVNGTFPAIQSSTSIVYNAWAHLAVVRSGSTITFYINGTSEGTYSSSAALNGNGGSWWTGTIGNSPSTGCFNGYISNQRVVNGTAVYTTNFTPPTSPLTAIANTQLLTLQSTTLIDNSTNAFTITAYGDSKPTIQNPFGYTNPSAAVYTASSYGGSMYFDGTGDYVTVANIPNLSSTQNWVVEAWVYPTYLTPSWYNRFVGGGDFNLGQYAGTWYLTNNSAGLLTAGSVTVNAWTHVAVVNKVGTGSYMCINGVIASSIGGASSFTMGNTKIGADVNGASNWYGYVSDFRVINNSTSSVYAANFVPPAAPLTATQNVTTLVSGASAGIYDSSMINEFESVGNTQISTAVKKYGNASIYFDGTGDYLQTTTAPNLQLNTGNFTIECWSYLTARVNGYPAIFSNYNSFGAGSLALFAGHGSSTTTQYQLAINGSFPAVNAGSIVYNSWVHLAVVRSGSTITLYVNGTSVGTASSSASLNGVGSNFYIGTTGDDLSGGCIQGYLDDFRVTLGVARYTSNFTPSSTPFIQK